MGHADRASRKGEKWSERDRNWCYTKDERIPIKILQGRNLLFYVHISKNMSVLCVCVFYVLGVLGGLPARWQI